MENDSERDGLWHLMGRSPRKNAPSGFAAEVLREIRRSEPGKEALNFWLRWLVPGFAAASLALVLSQSGIWTEQTPTRVADLALAEMIGVEQLIAESSRTAWADLEGMTSEN